MWKRFKQWTKHKWNLCGNDCKLCSYCFEASVNERYHRYMDQGLTAMNAYAKLYGLARRQNETDEQLLCRIAAEPDMEGE